MSRNRLSQKALDWAMLSVTKSGDTDVFPTPTEFGAIRRNWPHVRDRLLKYDITNYHANPPLRALTPKGPYGFRISTQLDPLDHLFFTALVYEVAGDLEKTRIRKARRVVHSYRCKPTRDGRLFDRNYAWNSFVERSLQLADSPYRYVVVTDIADFYQRIYFHRIERIEQILEKQVGKGTHGRAIADLIRQWNNGVSYGIPIGQAASHVLAEAVISDVDTLLLSKKIKYVRFSDDFHLFAATKRKALEMMAYLAQVLFNNHGLALQESKTEIITCSEFRRRQAKRAEDLELDRINANLESLVDKAGFDDWYELPVLDELPDNVRDELGRLNLDKMLDDEIRSENPDTRVVRWLVRRLSQVASPSAAQVLVANLDKAQHVIADIGRYLVSVAPKLDSKTKNDIGRILLKHLKSGIGACLPYHRAWALHVVRHDAARVPAQEIAKLVEKFDDDLTRREGFLVLGALGNDAWFRAHKHGSSGYGPWQRRSFLQGARCLPADEFKALRKARRRNAETLELAILDAFREGGS